jgi:5-formyltetrahydrofolate cyclo-ligase
MGNERNAYGILVGRAEVEEPFERARFRWEEDIKLYLKTQDESALTGLIWLMRDKCKRNCVPFESHKMQGISFMSCVPNRSMEVQDS